MGFQPGSFAIQSKIVLWLETNVTDVSKNEWINEPRSN